jgi:hypothetical protein
MMTIDNPLGNGRFMAATCRAHLRLISVGMTPPRGVRKGDILKMASKLTGVAYKRGEYKAAIGDLTALLDSPAPSRVKLSNWGHGGQAQ